MKLDLNNLPQDPQLLHQLVKELANDLNQKQAAIDKQQQENQRLQRRLDELMRHRFGRRSQKINPAQLALWQHALDEDIAETEQAIGKAEHHPAVKSKTKNKAKRKPLPANLPRQNVTYEHDQSHCACGHPLHKIGVQSCEELHWKPAEFYVIKHEQITYGCRHCQSVTTAEKPSRPIEKGILGSSMLAYLLVSKYQDHIPIDRVTKICERSHINLPTSTLTDALGRCGWILRPLVERLIEYLMQQSHLHTDDTVIPVLDAQKGQTKQGRLWVYLHSGTDGPPAVVFDYTPDRKQQGPLRFLENFSGYLQADGYPGYEHLYRSGKVQEVACWAHARAKFELLEKRTQSPMAQQALAFISKLYQIERQFKDQTHTPQLHQNRLQLRQEQALPILKQFKTFLQERLLEIAANSDAATPINYALQRWEALVRYCEDGRLNIDNNPAERCIRPITIGRKNWVFAATDLAAHRAAIIYSLIETCKINEVDPYAYFQDVLERIADHPNNDIDQLLPFNWKPTKAEA